jgi:hypothetical protein
MDLSAAGASCSLKNCCGKKIPSKLWNILLLDLLEKQFRTDKTIQHK